MIDTYLSQGRLDPFKIYPVEHVPTYVQKLLDHALRDKWPNVSPSDPIATKHDWMQCALSSPVAFYALSFAASQHLNYLHHGKDEIPSADLLRLSYKTEAVKLINRALSSLNGARIPDSLLIAILSLGAHGHKPVPHNDAVSSQHELKFRGPKSPLASAQMLDFYGHIDQETAHMSALRTLLAHNKGVQGVQLAGLAGALALGDLLHSTITHQKPSLNVTTPVRSIAAVRQFWQEGDGAGEGFSVKLSGLPSFKSSGKLLDALVAAKAVTTALDFKVHDGRYEDPSYADVDILHISDRSLILARNDVHHSLLSLTPANALWGREFALYEVLRVAGLVYSDLVLFPLPAETGVRGRYARMMREGMEGTAMEGAWREESGVLLWCAVLGAVASGDAMLGKWDVEVEEGKMRVGVGNREWFVGKVRMCAEMLGVGLRIGLKGWEEVKRLCAKYLWWADVCDVVGKGVWEEVVVLQSAILGLDAERMVMSGKGDEGWK